MFVPTTTCAHAHTPHTLFSSEQEGANLIMPHPTLLPQAGGPVGKLRLRLRGTDLGALTLLESSSDLSRVSKGSPPFALSPLCLCCPFVSGHQTNRVEVFSWWRRLAAHSHLGR